MLILLLKGMNSHQNGLVNIASLWLACFTIHKIKVELLQTFSSFVFIELICQDLKMDSRRPFKGPFFSVAVSHLSGVPGHLCLDWEASFLVHFILHSYHLNTEISRVP